MLISYTTARTVCVDLTFRRKTNVSRACHNKLAAERYASRCVGLFKVGVHTSDDWPKRAPGARFLRLRRFLGRRLTRRRIRRIRKNAIPRTFLTLISQSAKA